MPSRKVISIFIVSLALVVSVVIAAAPKQVDQISQALSGSLISGPEVSIASNDNWQNELQSLALNPSSVAIASASSTTDETLTDEFSRSFIANYIALKQSNTLDSNSAQDLLDTSVQFIEKKNSISYTLKDIVISPDNSGAALINYSNSLSVAFKNNGPKGEVKNEVQIFQDMLSQEDDSKSLELNNIALQYKNIAEALVRVSVPSSLSSSHLDLINGVSSLSEAVYDMAAGISDPLQGLNGIKNYFDIIENVEKAKNSIKTSVANLR